LALIYKILTVIYRKIKQKMPTGGYCLLDAAKTFAARAKNANWRLLFA